MNIPGTPPPVPSAAPRARLGILNPHTHYLRLIQDSPAGAPGMFRRFMGAEVWVKLPEGCAGPRVAVCGGIGRRLPATDGQALPGAPAEGFRYVTTLISRKGFIHYPLAQPPRGAVYRLRWVNTRGQPGPWSEAISAAVAA